MTRNLFTALRGLIASASVAVGATLLTIAPVWSQQVPGVPPLPGPSKDAAESAKDAAKDAKDTAKDTAKDAKDAAKDTAKDAKDTAKDERDTAKDTAKDARDTAKDTAKDARDEVRKTNKDVRDEAKDTRDTARDRARDARDNARETTRDARDTTRDARDNVRDRTRDARDTTRDTRENARDDIRDTREGARDRTRDARDTARDRTRDARDSARDTREDARDTVRDQRSSSRESRSTFTSRDFRVEDIRSADLGIWFSASGNDGLKISDISSRGPIARLGFREGDRLISVNGQRVTRERDFVNYVLADDVRDSRVEVIVLRGGREQTIYVEPTMLVSEFDAVDVEPLQEFGIVLDDRYTDRIVVWKVYPRTPAFYAGIRAGDVITTFHGQRVASPKEFVKIVQRTDPGTIAVRINRSNRSRDLQVNLEERQFTTYRQNLDEDRFDGADRRDDRRDRRDDRRDLRDDRRDDWDDVRENVTEPMNRSGYSDQPYRRSGLFRRR